MRALIFIAGILLSLSVYAGNPTGHTVIGKVLDENNLEGLTGASLRIVELDLVVYASFDGSFELGNIPRGAYTLEVRCVSYEKMVFEGVEVNGGKIYKKIFLKPV